MKPYFSRRKFLQAGAATTALSGLSAPMIASGATRNNVLFIGVDDLNTSLGCYGTPVVKTPNLDRLASRGVRFLNHHCQYPLCSPSRSSLMTGLAPDTTHIYDLQTHFRTTVPDAVTISQLFRQNGYFAARVGKIFHAGDPGQIGMDGLDDPKSWDTVYNPSGVDHTKEEKSVTSFTPHRGKGSSIAFYRSPAPDSQITDGIGAAKVIESLESYRKEPLFMAYGLYRPHVPWVVPAKYFDLFPLDTITEVPFSPAELKIAPPSAYWTDPPNFGMSVRQRKEAIQGYYAATAFMDAQVGNVLDALERLGLAEKTTIVFWSDHGFQLGQHGQWEKQTLFEHATRVPLIVAGAGVQSKGKPCHRTTEHVDIYPTLAEMFQLRGAPKNLHGKSLAPLLRDPNAPWSKPAVTQVGRPSTESPKVMGYSIRTERFRYTMWQDGEAGEELYDYQNDPGELTNLTSHAGSGHVRDKLRAQLNTIRSTRSTSTKTSTAQAV